VIYHARLPVQNVNVVRTVAALVTERQAPGEYVVQWNASSSAEIVHFYLLQLGGCRITKMLGFIK
jgi:hypothetical protein